MGLERLTIRRATLDDAAGVAQVIDEISVTGINPVRSPMTSRYHFSAELVRYFEERRQAALGREPNAWVA